MDTFETLILAGLSKKEAAVYASLLDNGEMSISGISKDTHINRPALYKLLPKLQKDGLISQVQRQKRIFYQAESPSRVLEQYQAEHAEVANRLEDLVEHHRDQDTKRPVIKYFEGRKGVLFVFDDVAHTLPRGGTFYRYSSRKDGHKSDFDNTYYKKARETKQLERLVITSEGHAAEKKKKLERSLKVIPKDFDLFADNISLVIYGDKTAYLDYNTNTSFIIESPKIARFQEKLFKLLWKKL